MTAAKVARGAQSTCDRRLRPLTSVGSWATGSSLDGIADHLLFRARVLGETDADYRSAMKAWLDMKRRPRMPRVRKIGGDYNWDGVLVAEFKTPDGKDRVVVAHPVTEGWVLHRHFTGAKASRVTAAICRQWTSSVS